MKKSTNLRRGVYIVFNLHYSAIYWKETYIRLKFNVFRTVSQSALYISAMNGEVLRRIQINLVAIGGIEPPLNAYETLVLPLNYMAIIHLVATERIELSSSDYRSLALTIKLCSNILVGALRIELRFTG